MVGFGVEFLRFLLVVLVQVRRWVFRKRRNFFVSLIVAGAAAITLSVLIHGGGDSTKSNRPTVEVSPTPIATVPYTEVQATPFAGDPESVPTATPKASATTSTGAGSAFTDPKRPVVDRKDPESVAKGFATAYLSRPSSTWDGWEPWVSAFTTSDIMDRLESPTEGAADEQLISAGKPTRVSAVSFAAPDSSLPRNTPVRWSRTLMATVETKSGYPTQLVYGIVEASTDDGWTITSVVQQGTAKG